MEQFGSEIASQVGGLLLPLGIRMVVGLAVGIAASVVLAIVYRWLSHRSAGLVGFLGAVVFGVCGFLLPLSFGIEQAAYDVSDIVIAEIEPEFRRAIAAQGLDPDNLDREQVQLAVDQFLTQLDEAEDAEIPFGREQQLRDAAGEIQQALDEGSRISVSGLATRIRDELLRPLVRYIPFVSGVLIAVPALFVLLTLWIGFKGRRRPAV